MIIAGYEYRNDKPFQNVYLTGMVRDIQRRKMSKSLGNSQDPIELMRKYTADGVRVGMLFCSPAGNDLLFDESLTEQGRNFGNKIWNAFRLVKSWEVDESLSQPGSAATAVQWFESKLNESIRSLDEHYDRFKLSEALMTVYKLFWDEFSSWYLEMVKPVYQKPVDKATLQSTTGFFEKLILLLHPFMPFITEEIWHLVRERKEGESIMISMMPALGPVDEAMITRFDQVKEIIGAVRTIRNDKNIATKEVLELDYIDADGSFNPFFNEAIKKMANVSTVREVKQKNETAGSFIVKNVEFYVPLGNLLNTEEELGKLEKELVYTQGFLESVLKKLENQKFVQNAPKQVLELELAKKADAESKISSLEKQILALRN
jgi:valyl-tRNA synthetase